MGLFSGLEKMGLGKLNKLEVFEEDTAKKGAKRVKNLNRQVSQRLRKKICCLINHIPVLFATTNFIQK